MVPVTGNKVPDLWAKLNGAAKADPSRRFHSLRDKLWREDVLREAWKMVKRNCGAGGIDGVSIGEIEATGVDAFLNGIAGELRNDTYRVKQVRRVEIPKPAGGTRTLGIPTVKDRVVQAAMKLVLEPIFEADFKDCSYGFRPGRSAHGAVREVYQWLNFGCVNVLDADIEKFFDSIPHAKLMALVERRVSDLQILRLIRAWLHHGAMKDGEGTPQGGVISPLLANIYLNELDKAWEARGMADRGGCDAKLIRYADDFVVLTSKALEEPYGVVGDVLAELGLRLNAEKTRTLRVEGGAGFTFLGFCFRRRYSSKWGKAKTYFSPSHANVVRVRRKVGEVTDRRAASTTPVPEVVKAMNAILRGWSNYFRVSDARDAFRRVQRHAEHRIRIFLQRRRHRRGLALRELSAEFLYGTLKLHRMGGIRYLSS